MDGNLESLPSKGDFSAAVGSDFTIGLNGATYNAILLSLDDRVSNDYQQNFTLLFRAEHGAPNVQSIYSLENTGLGQIELFLVPVRQDSDGLYYEAVFNLLLDSAA